MRRSFYLLSILAFVSSAASFACSSGNSDKSGAGAAANPDGNSSTTDPNNPTTQPEAPLAPRSVCGTLTVDAKFGLSCSGSGTNNTFCPVNSFDEDPNVIDSCGSANQCVYDERTKDTYSLYCSQKCDVGSTDNRCPIGYECAAPQGCAAGAGTQAYCGKRAGSGCDPNVKVGLDNNTFFEGTNGDLFEVATKYVSSTGSSSSSSTQSTLSIKQGNTFKSLATWDGPGDLRGLIHSTDSALAVFATYDVFIKDGKATTFKHNDNSITSTAEIFGITSDGQMTWLHGATGEAYATVSHRADDGTWTEVGPTQQRLAQTTALQKDFVARCQKTLCGSTDGQNFKPIALPDSVTIDEKSIYAIAGSSLDEFYFTTGGMVYHQRKGVWVTEGPHGIPRTFEDGETHADMLRAFSDGTVVFNTWVGASTPGYGGYGTYVYGNDCWSYSAAGNFSTETLAKGSNGNVFVGSSDGQLCTTDAR